MKAIVNHDRKFIFIIPPKCGVAVLKPLFIKSLTSPFTSLADYMIQSAEIADLQQNQNYKVYNFIRNPYSKIVSYYINRFIEKNDNYGQCYQDFKNSTNLSDLDASFSQALDALYKNPNLKDGKYLRFNNFNVIPDQIVKLEEFPAFLDQFLQEYNITLAQEDYDFLSTPPSVNNLQLHAAYDKKASEFTFIPNYKYFFNSSNKQKMEQLYANELAEFNYTYPYDN